MAAIDNFAPSKDKSVKGVSQEWFDVEIIKKLWLNNLKNNIKVSCLYGYKETMNGVQSLFVQRKRLISKENLLRSY